MNPERENNLLCVWLFIHDELSDYSDASVQENQVVHWREEMANIRAMRVDVRLLRAIPGLTDFDYRAQPAAESVRRFYDALCGHRTRSQYQSIGLDRFVLLTARQLDHEHAGMAWVNGPVALASTLAYQVFAHELGHTLGATHEDAEVFYNGWWHESYMSGINDMRAKAYRYSDKNRWNITRFLAAHLD